MKTKLHKLSLFTTLLTAGLLLAASPAKATNYAGNSNGGFGGPVGNGTLSVSDDGANITVTLQRGGGNLNDVLVVYIDTGAGGYADTSTLTDTSGTEQRSISGFNGGTTRSLMTFATGFRPSYAIAIKGDYMDVWSLANPAGLSFLAGGPQGGNSSASFSLTFSASLLGLAANTTTNIRIFGTLTASSAYRSTEAIAGNDSSAGSQQGTIPFTQTAFATYTFAAATTPNYPVTFSVDMSAQIASGAFNPANGDTVYASGTFLTNIASPFQLTATLANPNIYTGTYPDYNATNTAEQFKFNYISIANATNKFETQDNRPFTLLSAGVTNVLVYFDDVYPNPSATTNNLSFSIDMGPQLYLGHFNPANGDTIQVLGTLESPKWTAGGFILTNNPTSSASNIYSGTIGDGNYPGTFENYKFVIVTTGGNNYESGNNRDFFTPAGSYTFPLAYFNGVSNIYATPITFQVDMTAPLAAGTFNPANGDTVSAAGTFQSNQWTRGVFVLTNNPTAASSNVFSGTYVDQNQPGTGEQYKFQINVGGAGDPTGAGDENIANRFFALGSTAQTLPLVYWKNQDPNNVLLVPTTITFTVDMTSAVDLFGNPFDPANDIVMVDGDFITPNWQVLNHATDPLISSDYPGYVLANTPPGSQFYTGTFNLSGGNALEVTYKYGIYHNTSAFNTNVDNEAGFAQNHVRYIRTTGTYNFPVDIFGIQRTNQVAATEPSFGNLAISHPASGQLPITWLGRPGVHLQYRTNLISGVWVDLNTTDGTNSTAWPQTTGPAFFRLVNP